MSSTKIIRIISSTSNNTRYLPVPLRAPSSGERVFLYWETKYILLEPISKSTSPSPGGRGLGGGGNFDNITYPKLLISLFTPTLALPHQWGGCLILRQLGSIITSLLFSKQTSHLVSSGNQCIDHRRLASQMPCIRNNNQFGSG